MIKTPILTTKRLVLRALDDQDKNDMVEMLLDSLIKRTYMIPDLKNQEEIDSFFNKLKKLCSSDKYIAYAIALDNKVIGYTNSVSIKNNTIEMGYFINSHYWNKGYATEAFSAVIDELFRIGFDKIIAAHFEENPASGRVMQKCGMIKIAREETISYRDKEHRCIYYETDK